MSEKVVAIHGAEVATAVGAPVKDVVDELRRILAEAEAGRVRSFAIAYDSVGPRGDVLASSTWVRPEGADGIRLLGGVANLQFEILQAMK